MEEGGCGGGGGCDGGGEEAGVGEEEGGGRGGGCGGSYCGVWCRESGVVQVGPTLSSLLREPDEAAKASLPGFQVLPLRQLGIWGPEVKSNPDKDTYVMCHHGVRSLQFAKWLQSQRVYNIAGGILAYAVEVDPSVPTY